MVASLVGDQGVIAGFAWVLVFFLARRRYCTKAGLHDGRQSARSRGPPTTCDGSPTACVRTSGRCSRWAPAPVDDRRCSGDARCRRRPLEWCIDDFDVAATPRPNVTVRHADGDARRRRTAVRLDRDAQRARAHRRRRSVSRHSASYSSPRAGSSCTYRRSTACTDRGIARWATTDAMHHGASERYWRSGLVEVELRYMNCCRCRWWASPDERRNARWAASLALWDRTGIRLGRRFESIVACRRAQRLLRRSPGPLISARLPW